MFHLTTLDRRNILATATPEGMTRAGTFAVLAAGLMSIMALML